MCFIRSDESPHIEYLRTALSEARTRTLRTVDGGEISGRGVVDGLLHRVLRSLTTERPREQRSELHRNLAEAMKVARDPAVLLERFDSLETRWTPPASTGFEASLPQSA